MRSIKPRNWKTGEFIVICFVYLILLINALVLKDSLVAVLSAFFGITYTMLAGKGSPKCYLFGLCGSALYSWLALTNSLWGNLCLYALYYIPMQIIGFFKWNQHLKEDKNEIIKVKLAKKEALIITLLSTIMCAVCIYILEITGDKSPIIDGISTVLSVVGMYLTVKRAFEQWIVWIIVNGITAIMWINIAMSGEKVYSTVIMWLMYLIFAIYFFREWRKEVV